MKKLVIVGVFGIGLLGGGYFMSTRAFAEEQSCTHAGTTYAHDTRLCIDGKCMRCNNGSWENWDKGDCCKK